MDSPTISLQTRLQTNQSIDALLTDSDRVVGHGWHYQAQRFDCDGKGHDGQVFPIIKEVRRLKSLEGFHSPVKLVRNRTNSDSEASQESAATTAKFRVPGCPVSWRPTKQTKEVRCGLAPSLLS